PAGCGNGVLDPGEECDDALDATGCSRCRRTCAGQDTFAAIQNQIFAPTCAVTGCHGSFPQANLDLRPDVALRNLIGVLADNTVARAAGKRRVVAGDVGASFLSAKIHGTLAAGEGVRMPDQGLPLSQTQLDAIDAWIAAGAPSTGAVGGAPCLEDQEYVPAAPLVTPPGGYQIVLDGPVLQPGEEQEGCLWVPVPNATDFYVSKFEFSLNPGTHHFFIFDYQGVGAPQTGVWQKDNFSCLDGANFGGLLTGSPQAPYYVAGNPPGVARVLHAGHYLGLNAHYVNGFAVPIQIKVWTNIYPYAGTPEHIAQTLTDLTSTLTISVPPFTQQTHHGRYTNTTGAPMSFITLSGHMHFRGLRFTAWQSNGTEVYETYDWAHPGGVSFDPAFVLAPGDWFDYECLYDNGVEKPVRLDAQGNPTTLVFGVTTEDAMCILNGVYYTD
ncbi:MAG TPA: hypothetical protein VKU61_00490, partial [Candidatus Binatia bacterium]|nr:hypothetical protein [Candidatus Binatia bacterium]